MTISSAMQLIDQYGMLVLFMLALLEAMNCPGMPAGIILPAAGLFAAGDIHKLAQVYLFMLIGAVIGCLVLYCAGQLGGKALGHWLKKRSGKRKEKIEYHMQKMRNGNWVTIFICRLIPVVRTLGSLLAGIARVPLQNYLIGTVIGVALYNAVGIGLGYFAGWIFV